MVTKEQIKKEFFLSLLKGPHEPAIEDIVIFGIICKDLYKKYQYDITVEEFEEIGDELEEAGYFGWNADGHLGLMANGLEQLSKLRRG